MKDSKLAIIFGKGRPDMGGPKAEKDDGLLAAEDILRAIEDKDAEALDAALADHYRSCASSMDSGHDEPDRDDTDQGD